MSEETNPKIAGAVRAVLKGARPLDVRPQDEIKRRLNDVAAAIDERIPDGYGFIVLIAPTNTPDGILNYCASVQRSDAINMLKEFLLKCGAAEDWMQHIK